MIMNNAEDLVGRLLDDAEGLDCFPMRTFKNGKISPADSRWLSDAADSLRQAAELINKQSKELTELKHKAYLSEHPDCEEMLEIYRRSGREAALTMDHSPGWPAGCTSEQGWAWEEAYQAAVIEKERIKKCYLPNKLTN